MRRWEVVLRVVHDTYGDYAVVDETDRPVQTVTVSGGAASFHHRVHVATVESETMPKWEVIRRVVFDTGGWLGGAFHDDTRTASRTIKASSTHQHKVYFDVVEAEKMPQLPAPPQSKIVKPPYRVPTMAEIAKVPWNGKTVVSTFSGGGGSCLGYRMAGYRVAWASEFVEAARETYRANFPTTILDDRDIRKVNPEDILKAAKKKKGEIDVLDGSPPCSAFSTAGKRQKGWGKSKAYSDDKEQVVDDLFFEYARLLKGLQPKTFIAENVSGLIKGAAKGYFLEILAALKACGYNVKAALLDAAWLGVPQSRKRLIFVGVREDLKIEPSFPKPLPYQYTLRDAIAFVNELPPGPETSLAGYALEPEWKKLKQGEVSDKYLSLIKAKMDAPSYTVTAVGGKSPGTACVTHPTECRKFTIAELKRICAFPDDFVLTGKYDQQWERCGRAVPPLMMRAISDNLFREVLSKLR